MASSLKVQGRMASSLGCKVRLIRLAFKGRKTSLRPEGLLRDNRVLLIRMIFWPAKRRKGGSLFAGTIEARRRRSRDQGMQHLLRAVRARRAARHGYLAGGTCPSALSPNLQGRRPRPGIRG